MYYSSIIIPIVIHHTQPPCGYFTCFNNADDIGGKHRSFSATSKAKSLMIIGVGKLSGAMAHDRK